MGECSNLKDFQAPPALPSELHGYLDLLRLGTVVPRFFCLCDLLCDSFPFLGLQMVIHMSNSAYKSDWISVFIRINFPSSVSSSKMQLLAITVISAALAISAGALPSHWLVELLQRIQPNFSPESPQAECVCY